MLKRTGYNESVSGVPVESLLTQLPGGNGNIGGERYQRNARTCQGLSHPDPDFSVKRQFALCHFCCDLPATNRANAYARCIVQGGLGFV